MYIERITVNSEWQKVEDLLKDKISGFSFDDSKTYQLTTETISHKIRLCVLDTVPTDLYAGDLLSPNQIALYKSATGEYLYCRLENAPDEATLKVSEIG